MTGRGGPHDSYREERRKILRRATLHVYLTWLAALLVGVLGSAVVAWFFSRAGLPFRETWIVVAIIVIVVPLIGMAVGEIRRRSGREDEDDGKGEDEGEADAEGRAGRHE